MQACGRAEYNIYSEEAQKVNMIPIEDSFEMYHYFYQNQFQMFPPCLYYPPYFERNDKAAEAYQQTYQPIQPYMPKEIQMNTSEASAEPTILCKREEITEQKSSYRIVNIQKTPSFKSFPNTIQKKMKNQYQKQGRNANSNLLRMFFRRFHQRLLHDPEIITRILRKNKMKLKYGKFMEWLELNDVEHRNYVKLQDMKEIFIGGRGSRDQAKVMRVLLKDFLQRQGLVCYLTSKKIKRDSMPHNFHSIRNVLADIINTK